MRKRLLRSRSGFSNPESREEAIMQNILGASNVLEPSESNIEEILKSILYNTPYTKEAEFEIEKILLAIKNNGTYDGEGESRDMKILIAILKDLDYTEEAQSRIEELFIEWLYQRSSIKVLEGVTPLTFTSRGLPLINYLIEGNTVQSGTPTPDIPVDVVGCGVRTGNLFDGQLQQGYYTYYNGLYALSDAYVCTHLIPCTENTTYTFRCINTGGGSKNYGYAFFDSSQNRIGDDYINALTEGDVVTHTATTPQNTAFLAINIAYGRRQASVIRPSDITDFMLNTGSTPLPYEPYGYKIPISSAGQTFDVYIGAEPLRKAIDGSDVADTIAYSTQQLIRRVDSDGNALAAPATEIIVLPELPTVNGSNTLDVDTTVKPSNVYIEYK